MRRSMIRSRRFCTRVRLLCFRSSFRFEGGQEEEGEGEENVVVVQEQVPVQAKQRDALKIVGR